MHHIACVCTKNNFVFLNFSYLRKSNNDKGFRGIVMYLFKILCNISETIVESEVLSCVKIREKKNCKNLESLSTSNFNVYAYTLK